MLRSCCGSRHWTYVGPSGSRKAAAQALQAVVVVVWCLGCSSRIRLAGTPVQLLLKLPGCSQAAPLSCGRWCGDVSALYLMEYLLVRVRHARSTIIEAARPSRGTASESHREDCAPGSAEARLLPHELGTCLGCRKDQPQQLAEQRGAGSDTAPRRRVRQTWVTVTL